VTAGPLDHLIKALARLPGLGPRSARRIALHLLTARDKALYPLIDALQETERSVRVCERCGNLDNISPCRICSAASRHGSVICVVANVADLWAIERTGVYKGLYHCLGGVLSALDGITPDHLRIESLLERVRQGHITEIILALSATVDGQSTAHYISDRVSGVAPTVPITRLARGVPVGGELDYLDEGTIATALKSRAGL
jgi:recombination protein RecR